MDNFSRIGVIHSIWGFFEWGDCAGRGHLLEKWSKKNFLSGQALALDALLHVSVRNHFAPPLRRHEPTRGR